MSLPHYTDLDHGITAIDTGFCRHALAAAYLLIEKGRAAFIETGTSLSIPGLLAVLDAKGIARTAVDYVIPTHVHLDHGGGAGELMRHLPEARLIIHPRGARHMIDPSQLIAGASAVYGEEAMARLYGTVVPVPEARVMQAHDGDIFSFNGRELRIIDTPGHARHHFCIVDAQGNGVYTGDTFGISYREFDVAGEVFLFPTTTPVQFEPEKLHASVDKIDAQGLDYIYLTHYGRIRKTPALTQGLHEQIDAYVALGQALKDAPNRHQALCEGMMDIMLSRLDALGCTLPKAEQRNLLEMDVTLNVQGLEIWLDREQAA